MQPFRSVGLAHLGVFLPSGAQTACLSVDVLYANKDVLLLDVVQTDCTWNSAGWAKPESESRGGLLRGEVLKPANELATKVSAICLRASRPVGLFPFLFCSWIRLSNSSLKAWRMGGERETVRQSAKNVPTSTIPDRMRVYSTMHQLIQIGYKNRRHLRIVMEGRRSASSDSSVTMSILSVFTETRNLISLDFGQNKTWEDIICTIFHHLLI